MTTSHNNPHQIWFSEWLSRAWPRAHAIIFNDKLVKILPLINVVGIIGAMAGFVAALTDPKKQGEYLFYINDIGHLLLLITALFFFLPRLGVGRPHHNQGERDTISRAVSEFKIWLILLIILWFLFYVCRALADAPDALKLGDSYQTLKALGQKAALASDYLNIISALAFFGLYTTAEYSGASRWAAHERLSLAAAFIILVSILQIIAHAAPDALHQDLNLLAGIVNGLIVGIATALLIGRLDSKYIGLNKVVIITLYCYALIQPLFPYIFLSTAGTELAVYCYALIQPLFSYIFLNTIGTALAPQIQTAPESPLNLRVSMQYTFVALALVMKTILLLSLGRIIDTGILHFYVSSMQWVDKHVSTLRRRHERALISDGSMEVEPYLFSLVPPDKNSAKIHVGKEPDVRVQVGILNAWIGLVWNIVELSVTEVQISEAKFRVRKVRAISEMPVRVSEDNKFVRIELDLDLDIDSAELKEELKKDPDIAHAISQRHQTKQVKVIVDGLKAYASLLDDDRGISPSWHRFESVDLTNRLFYHDTLELEDLK